MIVALDVLVKNAQGWKAYEVKSSTSVSDTYVKDAAIQYYTILNSGIDLKDISIVYINNQYVKEGKLKIDELFTIESVKDRVLEYLPAISLVTATYEEISITCSLRSWTYSIVSMNGILKLSPGSSCV